MEVLSLSLTWKTETHSAIHNIWNVLSHSICCLTFSLLKAAKFVCSNSRELETEPSAPLKVKERTSSGWFFYFFTFFTLLLFFRLRRLLWLISSSFFFVDQKKKKMKKKTRWMQPKNWNRSDSGTRRLFTNTSNNITLISI